MLNGATTFFADTDQSGTDSFTVNPGDTFGFRIATIDSAFDPGIVTISAAASVPFEFSPSLGLLFVGGLFGSSHLYRKRKAGKVVLDSEV